METVLVLFFTHLFHCLWPCILLGKMRGPRFRYRLQGKAPGGQPLTAATPWVLSRLCQRAQGAPPTPDSLNGLGFAQLRKEQEWAPSGRDPLFPSGVLPRGAGWFVRSGGSGQNICHPHPKCLPPFKAARSEMKCFIFWYCSLKRK